MDSTHISCSLLMRRIVEFYRGQGKEIVMVIMVAISSITSLLGVVVCACGYNCKIYIAYGQCMHTIVYRVLILLSIHLRLYIYNMALQ